MYIYICLCFCVFSKRASNFVNTLIIYNVNYIKLNLNAKNANSVVPDNLVTNIAA